MIKQGAGNIKIVTTHIHQEEFIMSDFVASPERLITGALLGFAVLLFLIVKVKVQHFIAIAAGGTAFSHVNDSGFWLSKSLFEVDEKTNLKTWTVMETIVGLVGIVGATIVWFIVS